MVNEHDREGHQRHVIIMVLQTFKPQWRSAATLVRLAHPNETQWMPQGRATVLHQIAT